MSDPPSRIQAKAKLGRWPGLVWAVPLAAILIVGYLGLRALANQGVDVVVTFGSAGGARVGDTKVVYKGLEVGRVTGIRLNPDKRHVDLKLRLEHDLRGVVTTGTQFWLIGANPSFTDLASLKAAVAGLSIGMAPGPGAPTRHLIGLDEEPLVPPGTRGREFLLDLNTVGATRRGSTILYRGYEAGRVTDVRSLAPGAFQAKLFIQSPFDDYVRTSSLFWNASAVQISLTGQGISGSINSPTTALGGGVAFDTPETRRDDPPSPAGAVFTLYSDLNRAQEGPDGPQVQYQAVFHGTAGALTLGAPVSFGGTRIGVVNAVGLVFDPRTGVVSNPVTFGLFPERLHVPGADASPNPDWRAVSDRAVGKLLQLGYRVQIGQSPPLIGPQFIALAKVAGAAPAQLGPSVPFPEVPAQSEEAGDLYGEADTLLKTVNGLPIEGIGCDVRQITSRLSALLASPAVDDSLNHLDSTLKSVDQIASQVKPQIKPLVAKLNQTADQLQRTAAAASQVLSGTGAAQDQGLPDAIRQLTEAARSIRGLADYLSRHPESVIRGRPAGD